MTDQQGYDRKVDEAISEIAHLKRQLAEHQRMADLGGLTAGVAHEIKNPLGFICNFSELSLGLLDELEKLSAEWGDSDAGDLLEQLRFNARAVLDHGLNANSIINNILNMSQVGECDPVEVDLNHLVKEYVDLARVGKRAAQQDIQVTVEQGEDVPPMTLRAVELGRVIINLVNNALESLAVRASGDEDGYHPYLTVRIMLRQEWVVIQVDDNGVGIRAEDKPKLFEPFFSTKPKGQGNIGLGLSLCRTMVHDQLNGTLEVVCVPGVTRFELALPNTSTEGL